MSRIFSQNHKVQITNKFHTRTQYTLPHKEIVQLQCHLRRQRLRPYFKAVVDITLETRTLETLRGC